MTFEDRGDFFGGDYFRYDFSAETRWRVRFYGLGECLLGMMIIPATTAEIALRDAADFDRRFSLFVDTRTTTRAGPQLRAERMD